jgi:hypothetical protein
LVKYSAWTSRDGLEPNRESKMKTASACRRPSAGALCIPVNGSRPFIECSLRSTRMPLWLFTACREVTELRVHPMAPGAYPRREELGYITPVSRRGSTLSFPDCTTARGEDDSDDAMRAIAAFAANTPRSRTVESLVINRYPTR